MKYKITKCRHVTATERKHLKAFLNSGHTSAKVNRKTYQILKGTPNKEGCEYVIRISTPYIRESNGERDYENQTITLQTILN